MESTAPQGSIEHFNPQFTNVSSSPYLTKEGGDLEMSSV
jgi:hypothetical protein